MLSETKIPNRLINEKSPYLLQHAYNPVDWYPWGKEAFAKAKSENKPIFLSIGYSTCHWCHVMAHESFEDNNIADILNEGFIAIKVDREERADIDAVYMEVCQALTNSGGWPLTVFMTPEKEPFYAGTYFPKHGAFNKPGLSELLNAVLSEWKKNPEGLKRNGKKLAEACRKRTQSARSVKRGGLEPKEIIELAVRQFEKAFDNRYGGFGSAPKFPSPHILMFLVRYSLLEKDSNAFNMAVKTLDSMCRGGIFDHIGFGFSRYSTDDAWLVPHFEKMLYDNALIAIALLDCFQAGGGERFRLTAEKTFAYIFREMRSSDGGFYSAQDADCEGEEGKYYTFTPSEICSVLGGTEGRIFCGRYGIDEHGNFYGKSIPNLIGSTAEPEDNGSELLERLYKYRKTRYTLHKDDKVLLSWNALMIVALAKAHKALGGMIYLDAALKTLEFIDKRLKKDGTLLVSWRDGKSSGTGLLNDYAFLCWAALELYDATFEPHLLAMACSLAETITRKFADPAGGFYMNPNDSEELIFRPKETFDGAIPSGNSVFALCLSRLAALSGESRWRDEFRKLLDFLMPELAANPTAHSFALIALTETAYPSSELICQVAAPEAIPQLTALLGRKLRPNLSVLVKSGEQPELDIIAPFSKAYTAYKNVPYTFYLCHDNTCQAPFHDLSELELRL